MKHIEIAHEIIDYLHLVFPNDSIAIAGSVADGTFKRIVILTYYYCQKD
ncbi:hypothetical protein ACIXN2_09655 [Bacteroides fragilis]